MLAKKILIVDDKEINRDILAEILSEDYSTITAEDGDVALQIIRDQRENIAVVLLDLVMPRMNGFKVLETMKAEGILERVPVLIISGEDSVESEKNCFDLGASDFIRKPFNNALVRRRVKNIANLYLYKDHLEDEVESKTQTVKKQYEILSEQADILAKHNNNIIEILGTVVESRDLESGEHVQRVKGYTEILANQMMKDYPEYELTPRKISLIVAASALHDIGKIAIPDNVLLKPGRFTSEEFEIMKSHTTKGCDILSRIRNAWDDEYGKYSYEICRHHHERFDGRGYPDHLKEDEIPISAQCVSVADVYDALVNERCYKEAFSKDKAFEMIQNGECGTFSPKLMSAFAKTKDQFEQLADKLLSGV